MHFAEGYVTHKKINFLKVSQGQFKKVLASKIKHFRWII